MPQLYHPSSCPQEVQSFVDSSGTFNMKTTYMKPFVGDDGALHIVADRETINEQLRGLDLPRARTLTQVHVQSKHLRLVVKIRYLNSFGCELMPNCPYCINSMPCRCMGL